MQGHSVGGLIWNWLKVGFVQNYFGQAWSRGEAKPWVQCSWREGAARELALPGCSGRACRGRTQEWPLAWLWYSGRRAESRGDFGAVFSALRCRLQLLRGLACFGPLARGCLTRS